MNRIVPAGEARSQLPTILDQVEAGDEVTITRHGRPVAVVVRPEMLRRQRAAKVLAMAAELEEQLERARHSPRPTGGLSNEYAEELVREIRRERDRDRARDH